MDDGKLRALLTAVECGSFSKAAARLGYTQSAMTHLVNKLEAEVGCTLLERDSQGIRLTDAGRHLLLCEHCPRASAGTAARLPRAAPRDQNGRARAR